MDRRARHVLLSTLALFLLAPAVVAATGSGATADGFQKPIRTQPPAAEDVAGRGVWKDGRWNVAMVHALGPKEPERDAAVAPGRLIPLAVHAWDGASGEKGLVEWWLIRRVRRVGAIIGERP